MSSDRQPSPPALPRIARKQRWFVLWLVLGAGLAGLLLFDSISTYRFVSRILVINQVRRDLNKRAAQIERELQIKQAQTDSEIDAVLDKLQEEHEKLVWLVVRAPTATSSPKRGRHRLHLLSPQKNSAASFATTRKFSQPSARGTMNWLWSYLRFMSGVRTPTGLQTVSRAHLRRTALSQ